MNTDDDATRRKAGPVVGRVLLVTPQPFYEDRGTPIAVRFVARALSEIGFHVDLLAFPLGEPVEVPNVTIHRCANPMRLSRVPIGFSWKKVVLDTTLALAFRARLKAQSYDVVHAVEEAAYMASRLCPAYRVPFIYDMASSIPAELRRKMLLGTPPVQSLLRSVERSVLGRASHVICSMGLGDHVRREAAGTAFSEWRFPFVEPTGDARAVADLRRSLDIGPDDWVLVYTGNFASYQGVDTLLQAFAMALRSDPRLLLLCVGATDNRSAGLAAMPDPAVARRIRLVPRRPSQEVPLYLALANCLVSPRRATDNVPLKVFDYMGSGKPIIATRGRAHEPLLTPERAILCDGTADALADAILYAAANPSRMQVLAQTAGDYARRCFGWQPFVEFIRKTYAAVIDRG
jgi:glycosyltransferase involved in cell wall biosynthesis